MTLIRRVLLVLLLVSVPALACDQNAEAPPAEERSRSPFTTSPADLAVEEPCRFIGTFHKESRQRLEELRAGKVISLDEWACMARALKSLDEEMTVKCKEKKESIEVIEAWQTEYYSPCVDSAKKEKIVRCSLLTAEETCL